MLKFIETRKLKITPEFSEKKQNNDIKPDLFSG